MTRVRCLQTPKAHIQRNKKLGMGLKMTHSKYSAGASEPRMYALRRSAPRIATVRQPNIEICKERSFLTWSGQVETVSHLVSLDEKMVSHLVSTATTNVTTQTQAEKAAMDASSRLAPVLEYDPAVRISAAKAWKKARANQWVNVSTLNSLRGKTTLSDMGKW
jgi:hypothetical protein